VSALLSSTTVCISAQNGSGGRGYFELRLFGAHCIKKRVVDIEVALRMVLF
jgi:hypothetical protein